LKNHNVAYLSIATNQYVHYWASMIESANLVFGQNDAVSFIVFTDQKDFCESIAVTHPNLHISVVQIESLKWPEATLLRYKIYSKFAHGIDADVLCHIDADMLFLANPYEFLVPSDWKKGVALVAHPGYFRNSKNGVSLQQRCKDLFRMIRTGGLGTWETNRKSTAFVRRRKRNVYVCGGSWMAKKENFISLISNLNRSTEEDYENGVMAKWHDESHLNRWASENEFTILSPSFCYDSSYKWLTGIREIIRAVRK
jgi:hypothetical protein